LQWPGKKIKLDKQVIGDILVADSDSESGSEASNFEVSFEEEEEDKKGPTTTASLSRN